MLISLHVKNLGLIEQADVEFSEGLNIFTGETGAGKSILIGSVTIALGGKTPKDMIRKGADSAYIELLFSVTEQEKVEALKALDVYPLEDGTVIVSKKITPARSIGKINDETVTSAKLKEITSLLIDIHGQHEHQSLLYKSKHLEILDRYIRHQTQPLRQQITKSYKEYQELIKQMEHFEMDVEQRRREMDFCRYEIQEIEQAMLKDGEEEALSERYKRLSGTGKILNSLSAVSNTLEQIQLGYILKEMETACQYDTNLQSICGQLFDVDSILSDVNRDISTYISQVMYEEKEFVELEKRLDLIRNLYAKYGKSWNGVQEHLEKRKKMLEELEYFEEHKQKVQNQLKLITSELTEFCESLSEIRKTASLELTQKIKQGLTDLNFLGVEFEISFTRLEFLGGNGFDQVEFLISTNPGESLKPLSEVASGGELSRVMLAVKTVLADSDEIETLIFDEIDTGISGRTAQMVSEKLAHIGKNHQIICITHLPQIAAMADCHFEIVKSSEDNRTKTTICKLNEEEMIQELARLLGGAKITDMVLENAKEMKNLANQTK